MSPGLRTPTVAAAAVLVGVVAASASAAPAASCTPAAARAAVSHLKPRPTIRDLSGSPVTVSPGDVDQVLCFDLTRDGRRDLAVTIASGGTAGDVGWLALAATTAGYQVVRAGAGYKLGLARVAGDVVETEPVYRTNDPNCCPTGGFDHVRRHWNGRALIVTRRWHDTSYRP